MNAPVLFPACTQNMPHKNIAISAPTIGRMYRYIINIAIITIPLMKRDNGKGHEFARPCKYPIGIRMRPITPRYAQVPHRKMLSIKGVMKDILHRTIIARSQSANTHSCTGPIYIYTYQIYLSPLNRGYVSAHVRSENRI